MSIVINDYSKELSNLVNETLKEENWTFNFDEGHGFYDFGLQIEGEIKTLKFLIDVNMDNIVVCSVTSVKPDVKNKKAMADTAEFICRANQYIMNGGFVLDMNSGTIRFKTFIDCTDTIPSKEIIRNSIRCAVSMYRHFSSGILDVVNSEISPEEAIYDCNEEIEEQIRNANQKDSEKTDDTVAEVFGDIMDQLEEKGYNDQDIIDSENDENNN